MNDLPKKPQADPQTRTPEPQEEETKPKQPPIDPRILEHIRRQRQAMGFT